MKKTSVNICTYSRQFVQNIENIFTSTGIVTDKMKEGFDGYHEKFKSFEICLKEGNLNHYMKRIKAREKGVEIDKVELNEIQRLISENKEDGIISEILEDMENCLDFVKEINFENMSEFLNKSILIFLFTEFENYLFKCMKFILLKYPKILENKMIKLKEIKQFHGTENLGLINEIIAENTINSLFYKNYYAVFKYLKKPLGLEIDFNQNLINKLNGFKEIRNLITHGDGTINLLFQNRIHNWNLNKEDINLSSLELGEKISIDSSLISAVLNLIFDIIIDIDILMAEKFPELRIEMESLDHLFFRTYNQYLIEKWTNILKNY